MTPRFVFRTHYQVCEPAYLEFLVKLCSSPVQSSYREVVAKKLANEIEARCKIELAGEDGIKGFNEKAGEYAVDLARALEVINQNHAWTEKGHLIDLIADVDKKTPTEEVELDPAEKLLHFRMFFEGDGAAFLFLAKYFLANGSIQNIHSPEAVNPLAQDMFVDILREYHSLTVAPTDRLKLRRHLDAVKAKPFRGKGGTHKIKLHVHTLYRLGLLNSDGSSYQLRDPGRLRESSGLAILIRRIPDVATLERSIQLKQWPQIAAEVFNLSNQRARPPTDNEILLTLVSYYRRVMKTGVPLASLQTLIEATQIMRLAEHSQIVSYEAMESTIVRAQKQNPKDLRFHVDRRGRPAFLKMSAQFADSLAADKALA